MPVTSHHASQVKFILSPKQRTKPKTSAQKTGGSMPHCVARWVWLLRIFESIRTFKHNIYLGPKSHWSSQVKLILSPKQRAKPAASRTRTCTNTAVCIASGECPSRF